MRAQPFFAGGDLLSNFAGLTLMLLLAANSTAQTPDPRWVQRYGFEGAHSTDWVRSMAVDSASNVFVGGFTDAGFTGLDLLVVKYSPNGLPLWTNFNTSAGSGGESAEALACDKSGNVFVAGYRSGPSGAEALTIALSSVGVPVWTNTYSEGAGQSRLSCIAVDGSSNIIVAGDSGTSGATLDFLILKYSNAGIPLWTNRFNGPANNSEHATSLAVDTNGNVFVAGYCTGTNGNYDFATIKYSSAGIPLWTNGYNGPGDGTDVAVRVVMDPSGNLIVSGTSQGNSNEDYATIKYSNAGVPLWTNRYNGAGNGSETCAGVAVDSSGNVFVSGSSDGTEFATVKYSSAGAQQWVSRYSAGQSYASDIATDSAGNIFVTGSAYVNGRSFSTIKYSSAGSALWTNSYSGSDNQPYFVKLDTGGGVIVSGYSVGTGGSLDFATVKYSNSGVPSWTNRYDSLANGDDVPRAVAVDTNGNIFVTGSSARSIGVGDDFATIKYSSIGVALWTNRYDGPLSQDDEAHDLVLDASGNVIVVGRCRNNADDFAIVKYSNSGVPLWTNLFDGPAHLNDSAEAVVVDTVGNVLVTGSSTGNGSSTDFATIKYSASGLPVWTNRFNGTANFSDSVSGITVDLNGDVIVTGTSLGAGTGFDYLTIKYSSSGVAQWTNRYNSPTGTGVDEAARIATAPNGDVYVTGRSVGSSYDFATIAYSSVGVPLWTNRFDGPAHSTDQAQAMVVDGAGNVIVTGRSYDPFTWDDFVTIAYSGAGVPLWTNRYASPGPATDSPVAITFDANHNVIVAGFAYNQGSSPTADFVAVAYSISGVPLWTNRFDGPAHGNDLPLTAHSLAATDDGIVIIGESTSGSAYDYAIVKFDTTSPPQITVGPISQTTLVGTLVTLSASVTGAAPLWCQWRKNGTNIIDSENILGTATTTLSINNVQLENAGSFTLVVTNFYGSVTSAVATLVVLPEFVGASMTNPAISAKLIHASQPIAPSGLYWLDPDGAGPMPPFQAYCDMSTEGGGWTLILNSVAGSEAPTTEITNSQGTASLTTGHVIGARNLALNAELRHEIVQGSRKFHAKYTGNYYSNMPAVGSWTTSTGHTDFNFLANSFTRPFAVSAYGVNWYWGGSQTATPVNLNDAVNGPKNELQASVDRYSIWVREIGLPPILTSQPANRTNVAGTAASFTITAVGASSFQWRKDGTNLNNETNGTLTLSSVVVGDAGTYNVLVTNSYASVTSAVATLTVWSPPAITANPGPQTVPFNGDALFSVSASGTAPLGYQWLKNGMDVPGATGSSLILTNVQFTDAGQYSVLVTNFLGNATSLGSSLNVTSPLGGDLDASFDGHSAISGAIVSVVLQPDGRLVIGGTFTNVNGVARNRIARLNTDGSTDVTFLTGLAGANDTVRTVAVQGDGKVVIGGEFTSVNGVARGRVARLNADGTLDTSFQNGLAGANDPVYSVALQSDGKVVIGGPFTTVNGTSRGCVARLNTNGSLDTGFLNGLAGADNTVVSVALQSDGKVLIGGAFTSVNGVTRNGIARLNSPGTLDTTFQNGLSGANNYVYSVALQTDGKVLMGGDFTTVNGTTRTRIARLNTNGSLDTVFAPSSGANGIVWAISQLSDGKVFVGGEFTTINGATRNRFARLITSGVVDSTFQNGMGGANNVVYGHLEQPDGRIVICGGFTNVNSNAAQKIARVWSDRQSPPTINSQPQSLTNFVGGYAVFNVGLSGTIPMSYQWRKDGQSFTAGAADYGTTNSFLELTNVQLSYAGGYDLVISNMYGSVTSAVAALTVIEPLTITAQPQSRTNLVGTTGTFTVSASGTAPIAYQWRKDGANLNGETTATLTLPSVVTGDAGDYEVLVTNDFGSVTSALATLTVVTPPAITGQPLSSTNLIGTTATFTVSATGTDPLVYQWRKGGTNLVNDGSVGGANTATLSLTNVQATSGASYDVVVTNNYGSVTSTFAVLQIISPYVADPGFDPGAGPNGFVFGTASQLDRKVAIVGQFNTVAGVGHNGLARLGTDGSLDTNFNPTANSAPYGVAMQPDGKIVVAGSFQSISGISRKGIARLNSDGTVDTSFNANASDSVFGLALQRDDKILIAGLFTNVASVTRTGIARLNVDGTLDTGFDPGANSNSFCVAVQENDKILVGGDFTLLGGTNRSRFGRLNPDGALDNSFDPNPDGSVRNILVQADGRILISGLFTKIGATTRNGMARLNADGTLDASFNPSPNAAVNSMALQADGRILIAGGFGTVGGVSRFRIARLNPDGFLDNAFDLGASVTSSVFSIMLQPDGRLLLGGSFTNLGGLARTNVAQVLNDPGLQALTVPSAKRVEWLRGGSAPETTDVSFDLSTNGSTWFPLGRGERISGGWQLTGLNLPANGIVRARARATGGWYNSSLTIIEEQAAFSGLPTPDIVVEQPAGTNLGDGISTVNLGTLLVGGSNSLTFTIRNVGTSDLDGLAITITGPDAASFAFDNTLPVLLPGLSTYSATFAVHFLPMSAGDKTAILHIHSNDPDENPFDITLSGIGTTPPVISQQPQSRTNAVGTEASFSVAASGQEPLTYQWRRTGTNLVDADNVSGASTSALDLANVQLSDAASYDVVIANVYGTVTGTVAMLTVVELPSITTQPQSRTNLAGTAASFSVSATGTAPLAYQWRKDGTTLSYATNATLSFANVQVADQGGYSVLITNPYGSVTSAVASLTVQQIIRVSNIIASATTELSPLGRYASNAVNGIKLDSSFWESGGLGWGIDDRAPAITFDLQGVYRLDRFLLWNSHEPAPAIKRMRVDYSQDGTNFTDFGEMQMSPSTASETPSDTNSLSQIQTRFVRFVILQNYDGQRFPYAGANTNNPYVAVDEVEFYGELLAPVVPRVTQQPVSFGKVMTSVTVGLSVACSGTPPLTYQWYRGGGPIVEATNVSLYLGPLTTNDSGIYSLVVSNAAGGTVSQPSVIDVVPPSPPLPITIPGLLAYYSFDNTASDLSGNGWHAQNFGAVITRDRFDVLGGAFAFTNTYMLVSNLDPDDYPTNFSIGCWFRGALLLADGSSGQPTHIERNTLNGFLVRFGSNPSHSVAAPGLVDAQWNHVIVTHGKAFDRFYLNGTRIDEWPTLPLQNNISPFQIGYYPSVMDDVVIYGRELSESEVAQLSSGPSPFVSLAVQATSTQVILTLSGTAGSRWNVERAFNLTGSWTNIGVMTISANGLNVLQDPNPPDSSAFYRASYAP